MFKFILIAALVACAYAVEEVAEVKSDVRADGFDYSLGTSTGIAARASGDVHGNIVGSFGWTSPEGVPVHVDYVANENGYQPASDLLPTPPPIPAAIIRSLEWNAAHPQQEVAYIKH